MFNQDAKTTEVQSLITAIPGKLYILKSEAVNHGVPYCDTFCVRSHWCLTRGTNSSQTHLMVHAEVFFKKSSWSLSLVKPLIEKNAMQGVTDYVRDCVAALHKYGHDDDAYEHEQVSVDRLKLLLRTDSLGRSRSLDIQLEEDIPLRDRSNTAASAPRSRTSTLSRVHEPKLVATRDQDNYMLKIILVILFLLFVSNIFLYMQLWKLEHAANEFDTLYGSAGSNDVTANTIAKWKLVLSKAMKLINLMERNLQDMKVGVHDEL